MSENENLLNEVLRRRNSGELRNSPDVDSLPAVSRQQLLTRSTSLMTQCFIGAIDSFETHFGVLWGHGLSLDEISPVQIEYRKLWSSCRKEILDKGNDRKRELNAEFSSFNK